MQSVQLALLAALVASCFSGCKKTSEADLSTPARTLESFFQALKEDRIPEDLNTFVIDDFEKAAWKVRCKTRGCKEGEFHILEVLEEGANGAVLIVNYQVLGKGRQPVMVGRQSPIRFEREGASWRIAQFGNRLTPTAKPGATPDAGADQDAPGASDAAPDEDAGLSP